VRTNIKRRTFLAGAATLAAAAWLPDRSQGQGSKTRLILLGTGGGPRPRKASSAPAQVIIANDTPYVVDCGNGVARQLIFAGVALPKLRHLGTTSAREDDASFLRDERV